MKQRKKAQTSLSYTCLCCEPIDCTGSGQFYSTSHAAKYRFEFSTSDFPKGVYDQGSNGINRNNDVLLCTNSFANGRNKS